MKNKWWGLIAVIVIMGCVAVACSIENGGNGNGGGILFVYNQALIPASVSIFAGEEIYVGSGQPNRLGEPSRAYEFIPRLGIWEGVLQPGETRNFTFNRDTAVGFDYSTMPHSGGTVASGVVAVQGNETFGIIINDITFHPSIDNQK